MCVGVGESRSSPGAPQPSRASRCLTRPPARPPAVEDAKRKASTPDRLRKRERELAALERSLANDRARLMGVSMRPSVLVGLTNMALWYLMSMLFAGVVMCRLPFTPFALLTGMTHRGLPGADLNEVNFLGVFALTNMVVRPLVARAFGHGGSGAGAPAGGTGEMWSQLMDQASKLAGPEKSG